MPDVNPKIAFHINGDEHQVNIKLCYISNCATTYCQTLCKTTSDRRYIGNRMIQRKLIMKYSSTETRSDSAAWQHLDLLIICIQVSLSEWGGSCFTARFIYSHIHVLRRHLLRLASTIPPHSPMIISCNSWYIQQRCNPTIKFPANSFQVRLTSHY